MSIIPAILAHGAHDLTEKLFWPGVYDHAQLFHVDVLDGSMFGATCFHDPAALTRRSDAPNIELHLMVENPLPIMETWLAANLPVTRAIVHAEIGRPLGAVLERVASHGVLPALAVNPETPIDHLTHHFPHLNELLVMGVHPGASGRSFLGDPILAKIARLQRLSPTLTLGIDGGVTLHTLPLIKQAGITNFVLGSAIWQSADPAKTYAELAALAQN